MRTALAQDAVRLSLAGAEAAEARSKAATKLDYYNLKVGPAAFNFGTALGMEYNNNVSLAPGNAKSDLILRPEIDTHLLWPVTDKNSLNLELDGGYSIYALNAGLNGYFIRPGTELSFDVYVGDLWLNFHDRLSVMEDAYQDPTVTGTGDYSRLENSLGANGVWDLNKLALQLGYDHVNYISVRGPQRQPDGESELLSSSAAYAVRPGLRAGLEAGGGFQRYTAVATNSLFSNAAQWNLGTLWDGQLTEYVHIRADAGYTSFLPEARPTIVTNATGGFRTNNPANFSGVYAQVTLKHRLNPHVDFTLTGGRSISSTFFGGTIDLYQVQWQAEWRLLRQITLTSAVSYEHGRQTLNPNEVFDRYGVGLTMGYPITSKLTGRLSYQFYWRGSNHREKEYLLNILNLNLAYKF